MTPPINVRPDEDDNDALIAKLAMWALEERKNQIDPDSSTAGTWLGAISMPLFEGLSINDTLVRGEGISDDPDRPEPGFYLIDEMRESYGVGREWGGDHGDELAEAAATLAAAVYDELGLTIPEEQPDDGETVTHNGTSHADD